LVAGYAGDRTELPEIATFERDLGARLGLNQPALAVNRGHLEVLLQLAQDQMANEMAPGGEEEAGGMRHTHSCATRTLNPIREDASLYVQRFRES
jgi:hypothetical protein